MAQDNGCVQCFTQELKNEVFLFAIITRVNTVGWIIGIVSLLYTFSVLRSLKSDTLSKPLKYLLALGLIALTALLFVYSGFCIWERVDAMTTWWSRYRPDQFQDWWWSQPDRRPNDWITYISITTSILMTCLIVFLLAKKHWNQYLLAPVLLVEIVMLVIPMGLRLMFRFQLGLVIFLIAYAVSSSLHGILPSKERRALGYFIIALTAQIIISIIDQILIRRGELQATDFNLSVAVQALALAYLAQGGLPSDTGEIALTDDTSDA